MNANASSKRSPLKFFIFTFVLATPIWALNSVVRVGGLPLDIPVTDVQQHRTERVCGYPLPCHDKYLQGCVSSRWSSQPVGRLPRGPLFDPCNRRPDNSALMGLGDVNSV